MRLGLNPYIYPKKKHTRSQQPDVYRDYRKYKPFLREEFERKCVYCRAPDGLAGPDNFGVDHYRPKSLFDSLIHQYSNLYYACNACNRWKGSFWPDAIQRRAGIFIPNPCDHIIFEHLRFKSYQVESRSSAGAFAAELLHLNDTERVEYRSFVLAMVADVIDRYRQLNRLQRQLSKSGVSRMDAAVRDKVRELEDKKDECKRHLSRLTGIRFEDVVVT